LEAAMHKPIKQNNEFPNSQFVHLAVADCSFNS
jgi:hypothetical protein